MPVSRPQHLSYLSNIILEIKPKTILDIGVGFGLIGMIFRQYTDIWNGNYKKENWQTRIDGIEIFKDYIGDIQLNIYDKIHIGNALDVLPNLDKYDLIYAGDVLEHFTKEDGWKLVKLLREKGKNVIIVTPKVVSKQGAAFNNVYETHRSQWTEDDFPNSMVKCFNNVMMIEYNALKTDMKTKIISDMGALRAAFDQAKIPWVNLYGVALGYGRYKDIMAWDTDIDMGVFVELTDEQRQSLNEALIAHGFWLHNRNDDFVYCKRTVSLNIFFFHKNGNYYESFPKSTPGIKFIQKASWFDNPQEVDFLGDKYLMPNHIDDFLTCYYGKDWETNIIKNHSQFFMDKRGGKAQSAWTKGRSGKYGDLWPTIMSTKDDNSEIIKCQNSNAPPGFTVHYCQGMSFYGDKIKLDKYANRKDTTLFLGLYFDNDYNIFKNHEGKRIIFWNGSDVIRMLRSSNRISIVTGADAKHYCHNEQLQKELKSKGINAEIAALFFGEKRDYPISYKQSDNPKVFMCAHPAREAEYGIPMAIELAKELPEIEFHIYGIAGNTENNLIYHGQIEESEMDKQIKNYQGCLRFNKHDGVSQIVLKSKMMGLYPIISTDKEFVKKELLALKNKLEPYKTEEHFYDIDEFIIKIHNKKEQ